MTTWTLRLWALLLAAALALAGGAGSGKVTLRVRLPNGMTKRVEATDGDTVAEVRAKAAVGEGALFADARCTELLRDQDEVVGRFEQGAMLFCKSQPRVTAAAAFKDRSQTTAGGVRTFDTLSEEQGQLRVKRQETPGCHTLSLSSDTTLELAAYLQQSDRPKVRRVALLFGTTTYDEKGQAEVRVDAVWEPPQPLATNTTCDTAALRRAVEAGAPAVVLARGLGMGLVGWLFSHPARDYFLSDQDILITAELQRAHQQQQGSRTNLTAPFVVVAARTGGANVDTEGTKAAKPSSKGRKAKPDANANDDIAFEGYEISEQARTWARDGTFVAIPPAKAGKPTAPAASLAEGAEIKTTREVIADGKHTTTADTALFTVPVPIKAHQGRLRTAFPPANRPERRQSARLMNKALFGEQLVGDDGRPLPLETRLRDFHLLNFLSRRVGDMGPLLECICNGRPVPSYYRMTLEQLCSPTAEGD